MKNVRSNISVSLDLEVREILESLGPNRSQSVSDAIRIYDQVLKYKNLMNDPNKATEFQTKMKERLEREKMVQWAETLSDVQIEGLVEFLQMQKEERKSVMR